MFYASGWLVSLFLLVSCLNREQIVIVEQQQVFCCVSHSTGRFCVDATFQSGSYLTVWVERRAGTRPPPSFKKSEACRWGSAAVGVGVDVDGAAYDVFGGGGGGGGGSVWWWNFLVVASPQDDPGCRLHCGTRVHTPICQQPTERGCAASGV